MDASVTESERFLLASRKMSFAWVRGKCAALRRRAKSRVVNSEVMRAFASAAVSTVVLRMVVRLFRQNLLLRSVGSVCGGLQSLVLFRILVDISGTVATTKLHAEFRMNSTRRSKIKTSFVSASLSEKK